MASRSVVDDCAQWGRERAGPWSSSTGTPSWLRWFRLLREIKGSGEKAINVFSSGRRWMRVIKAHPGGPVGVQAMCVLAT